ncbi:MAG: DUF6065 family protein, partial [Hyphomonadaceae bacterium]|nr:DUF6065 family protein [Hyphomonadaceae bacterium]
EIVPARSQRDWMDAFPDRHPYRCLPLTMANSTGWEILAPMHVKITWDGGPMEANIKFSTKGDPRYLPSFVDSHFRRGIVTFHTGHLFRTPPGWGVWATGAPNWPKDGVAPLTGLIETDWLPFPFTMNWQMTRPGSVEFQKGEPFCFITLMEHRKLEEITPERKALSSNPDLVKEYEAWRDSRADFNTRLHVGEESALKERWQRHYMRGQTVTGDDADAHQTKRRMHKPKEM